MLSVLRWSVLAQLSSVFNCLPTFEKSSVISLNWNVFDHFKTIFISNNDWRTNITVQTILTILANFKKTILERKLSACFQQTTDLFFPLSLSLSLSLPLPLPLPLPLSLSFYLLWTHKKSFKLSFVYFTFSVSIAPLSHPTSLSLSLTPYSFYISLTLRHTHPLSF